MLVKPSGEIQTYLVSTLAEKLKSGQKVLWLVPGGSAMTVAVAVARELQGLTSNLRVTLTDERLGELGHADENYLQLEQAGFSVGDGEFYRVLTGGDDAQTAENYSRKLDEWLDWADYRLGLFGIGSDGHTAGIKPGSPAVSSKKLVEVFSGDDFERITITPHVIARLDESVAYADGDDKQGALAMLVQEDLPIEVEPAQSLKLAGQFSLFTDVQLD